MTEKEKLLLKLQQGVFTKQELEKLLFLIEANPEEDDQLNMKQLWQELDSSAKEDNKRSEQILSRTLSLIEKESKNKSDQLAKDIHRPPLLRKRRMVLKSAAAIVILILGTFSWLLFDQQQTVSFSTNFGEQLKLTLPDQSIVTLNSNSTLSYQKKWGDKESRQVNLKGEAFFEVRKNEEYEQKFEVITNDLRVEVLGTTFNVNAREKMTSVFLEEGKVNLDLEDREDDIDMNPGDVITYSRLTGVPQRNQIVEEVPASWRDGTVEFKDSRLEDILLRLKEIYGVEVVYENDSNLDRKYRISIPLESFEIAFKVLKEVTGLELIREDNKIIVK